MSDQLNLEPESQPQLRLAAQDDRARPPARPVPRAAGGRPCRLRWRRRPPSAHLTDYVKVLTSGAGRRRPRSCWSMAARHRLHVHGDADLRGADPAADRSRDPNVVTFKEVIDEDQTKADYYQTQYNILQSRALARKTIDEPEAVGSPAAQSGEAGQGVQRGRAIGGAVGLVAGLFTSAPAAAARAGPGG